MHALCKKSQSGGLFIPVEFGPCSCRIYATQPVWILEYLTLITNELHSKNSGDIMTRKGSMWGVRLNSGSTMTGNRSTCCGIWPYYFVKFCRNLTKMVTFDPELSMNPTDPIYIIHYQLLIPLKDTSLCNMEDISHLVARFSYPFVQHVINTFRQRPMSYSASTNSFQTIILYALYTGVKLDPEKGPWCQTLFRVNDDPEISQLDAEYDPELGNLTPLLVNLQKAD